MREALQEERKKGGNISCNLTFNYSFPGLLIYCNTLCFRMSFSINVANSALNTILNLVYSENGLPSCPEGIGYKEEFQSGLLFNYFFKFFSLKDKNNLLDHVLIGVPMLLLPVYVVSSVTRSVVLL